MNGGEAGSDGVRESQKSWGDSRLGEERVTAKALEGGGCSGGAKSLTDNAQMAESSVKGEGGVAADDL